MVHSSFGMLAGEGLDHNQDVLDTGDIAKLLKVSSDKVDYWVRSKLIVPSIREASGHGSRRLFNANDLKLAILIHRLRNAKWKSKQIICALHAVSEAMKNPDLLQSPLLVHEGNALFILCRSKGKEPMLFDAASPGQRVMVIALETLDEEARESLLRGK